MTFPILWLGLQFESRKSEFRVIALKLDCTLTPFIGAQEMYEKLSYAFGQQR